MSFPTPIGGTAMPLDFAPSILFAILYSLLTPLMVYRLWGRRSRTLFLIGTVAFSVERVVIFALRAVQARNEDRRISKGLITYMQISFGLGFIGIANDLVNLVACLLINPTYGSEFYSESPAAHTKDYCVLPPPEGMPDHPRQRFWTRRFNGFTGLAFLAATVPGILANSQYKRVFESQEQADKTFRLRYASTGVALFLSLLLLTVAALARSKLPRVSKKGADLIMLLSTLLSTIAIYRLSVMFHTSTSLDATVPGTLNSTGAKATFYIFHVLPEWLATVLLFTVNVRKTLGTGLAGDWRGRDMNEKQRKKAAAKLASTKKHEKEPVDGVSKSV